MDMYVGYCSLLNLRMTLFGDTGPTVPSVEDNATSENYCSTFHCYTYGTLLAQLCTSLVFSWPMSKALHLILLLTSLVCCAVSMLFRAPPLRVHVYQLRHRWRWRFMGPTVPIYRVHPMPSQFYNPLAALHRPLHFTGPVAFNTSLLMVTNKTRMWVAW